MSRPTDSEYSLAYGTSLDQSFSTARGPSRMLENKFVEYFADNQTLRDF